MSLLCTPTGPCEIIVSQHDIFIQHLELLFLSRDWLSALAKDSVLVASLVQVTLIKGAGTQILCSLWILQRGRVGWGVAGCALEQHS